MASFKIEEIYCSLHKFLTYGADSNKFAKHIWKCKIPLKVRIFLWRPFKINFRLSSSLKRGIRKGVSFVVCCDKELERG
jgi:hypothetical protein